MLPWQRRHRWNAEAISPSASRSAGYIADADVATTLELVLALEKPLLVEGPAGVGKTESAKVLADVLETNLIRLQCYEGLDAANALYEWNYPKQLLHIRLTDGDGTSAREREAQIFGRDFLLARPLLEAISQERAPVLLIDEIDRADEAFEAFLLELLGEFQVTIPEIGTLRAKARPAVVVTSNRTRDLSDALRRRCLYLWIGYPSFERELEILARAAARSRRAARAPDRALYGVSARAAVPKRARHRREPRLGARARAPASRCARRTYARSRRPAAFSKCKRIGSCFARCDRNTNPMLAHA